MRFEVEPGEMDFTSTFTIDSTIRQHHVYKEIWTPIIGEELACADYDPYAVKVGTVVGHIQCRISATCNLLLKQGGTILFTVSGPRLYTHHLPNGGLDVPCKLSFDGTSHLVIKKLQKPGITDFKEPMSTACETELNPECFKVSKDKQPASKKQKVCLQFPQVQ